MAIKPDTQYPGKVAPATAAFPYGSAQNITVPSDGTGTPWEAALVNDLFGMQQALLSDAGIVPSGTPDEVGASQYLEAIKLAALGMPYTSLATPGVPNISLKGFLDRQGIWAATQSEIQDANDYLVTAIKRDVIRLPPGSIIPILTTIDINASFVGIEGNNAFLFGAGLASPDVAIEITAPVVSPSVPFVPTVLRNFSVNGPGAATGSVGISFRNTGGGTGGPATLITENVALQDFFQGQWYDEAVFPVASRGCEIKDCGSAIVISPSANGGAVRWHGGIISGCGAVIVMSDTGRIVTMFGTEMLGNDKLFALTGGLLELHGCTHEAADYGVTPITISGAGTGVEMFGGSLIMSSAPPMTAGIWVDAGAGSFFRGRGVQMDDARTASGAFATGAGSVKMRGTIYDVATTECPILNLDSSMLADGGFEEATIADDVYITAADAAITDRHTVGTTALAVSASQARTGAQSLKYSKTAGPVSESRFALASIPVRPFDRTGGVVFWRRPGAMDGVFLIEGFFVKVVVNSDGVPTILKASLDTIHDTVNLSPGDTGWLTVEIAPSGPAPEWATHFIVEIDGDGLGVVTTGDLYFDDLNVNIIG